MEQIEINHFKVFGSGLSLNLPSPTKNLLLYGENGAGKTSLFEALKLIFFHDRLLRAEITIGGLPELRRNEEEAFYRGYRHQRDTADIELKLNGTDFRNINRSDYQCFMVSNIDVESISSYNETDAINLKALLENAFIDCDDVETFMADHATEVISRVNLLLAHDFVESVQIGQENTDYNIYIEDAPAYLRASEGLHGVYNEAKLNLIRLLLLLESIRLLQSADTSKHKVLVLDDVVTSLDACNRLYTIEYLLANFGGFQKIVLTHNIGFNNLFARQLRKEKKEVEWVKLNMYQTQHGTNVYDYDALKKAKDIREAFRNGSLPPNTVGNEIRKHFEAVVLELTKILQIESSQEVRELVTRLVDENKPIYIRRKARKILTSNDLVTAISDILDATDSDAVKVQEAKQEINEYHSNPDLQRIIPMVRGMQTYQKVMMHQLSHGVMAGSMPPFSQKEIEGSLCLLEKLEKEVNILRKNIGMM